MAWIMVNDELPPIDREVIVMWESCRRQSFGIICWTGKQWRHGEELFIPPRAWHSIPDPPEVVLEPGLFSTRSVIAGMRCI